MARAALAAPRDQEGAVSLVAAAALVATITVLALGVDTGRLYFEQRQLQGAADAAALAAVAEAAQGGDMTEAARDAASRNHNDPDREAIQIQLERGRVITNEKGRFAFHPRKGGGAVRVTMERATPKSLVAGTLLPGDASLEVRSVARLPARASLQAGSFLANVDTGQSQILDALLSALLKGEVDLNAAHYGGLVGSQIRLGDLVNLRPNVGTVEELLELDLGLTQWLELFAKAVEGDNLAELALNQFQAVVDPDLNLRLGDLVEVVQGGKEAALDASLNAFQLVTSAAQVANKGHAVALNLGSGGLLSGLGLADLETELTVIEPPQMAIGPPGEDPDGDWWTRAETGQIELNLQLELLELLLGGIEASIRVEAAHGEAWLKEIRPATLEKPAQVYVGAETGIADLQVALSGNNLLDLGISEKEDLAFTGPFDDPEENTQTIGTDLGQGLGNALEVALLGDVISAVVSPLLDALGIKLGGMDVTVVSVNSPRPELVE